MTTIKKKTIVATAAAITILGTFIETQQVVDAQAATSTFKAASSATKALRYKATKATTMRKSANTTSAKVASLPKNAFVKVTGTQASYTKVTYKGKVGFVPTAALTVKKATGISTVALTGKITKAATLRNTYGTDWTTTKVTTVAKNKTVHIKKYVTFDNVKYAQVIFGTKTGYIAASSVSAVDPYPTKTPSGITVKRNLSNKAPYIYKFESDKPVVGDPSDIEHTRNTMSTSVVHIIGDVTVDGMNYKQIVLNGVIGYVKSADFKTNAQKVTAADFTEFIYDESIQKILVFSADHNMKPPKTLLGNDGDIQLSKGTKMNVIARYDSKNNIIIYKVKYKVGSTTYTGYLPSSTITRVEKYEQMEPIVDSPSNPNKDDEKVSEPSKDTPATASDMDTYIGDKRRRLITFGSVIYKNMPTSKTSASYVTSYRPVREVLKISSIQSSKIGDVVKVVFSTPNGMKTGYVLTKYVKDVGTVALASSFILNDSNTVSAAGGNLAHDIRFGSKEGYQALSDAMQTTFYVPLLLTTDNVLLPGTSLSYYSKYADEIDIRYTAWSDISQKTIKLDGIFNGSSATPISVESLVSKHKKTKNYVFDTQDNFNANYKHDIHKTVANLIVKHGLENNAIVYVSDGQQKSAVAAAEIHAISPKIKVIQTLTLKQQKSFKSSDYNTKDLHGFAFNAENITDSVVTDLQKNNLSINVHRENNKQRWRDIKTEKVSFTHGIFSTTHTGASTAIGYELNVEF